MTQDELGMILASAIDALQSDAGGLLFVKFPADSAEDMEQPEEEAGPLDLSTELEAPGTTGRYGGGGGGSSDGILMDNSGQ